jgi:hypothetical protein
MGMAQLHTIHFKIEFTLYSSEIYVPSRDQSSEKSSSNNQARNPTNIPPSKNQARRQFFLFHTKQESIMTPVVRNYSIKVEIKIVDTTKL